MLLGTYPNELSCPHKNMHIDICMGDLFIIVKNFGSNQNVPKLAMDKLLVYPNNGYYSALKIHEQSNPVQLSTPNSYYCAKEANLKGYTLYDLKFCDILEKAKLAMTAKKN